MVEKGGGNVKRVNRDQLRAMLDNSEYSPANEKLITTIRDNIINTCLSKGYDVIVDETSLRPKVERGIRKLVGNRANIQVIYMDVPLEECLKRNALREGVERVPDHVIEKQAENWEKWKHVDCTDLGASDLEFAEIVHDPNLPTCIIVDIDGTLAKNNSGRGWYDWAKVGDDDVVEPVASLVRSVYKNSNDTDSVIIFSGRDSVCRKETEVWLETYDIPYDHLFMRPEGDQRKDSIVKSEMFDEFILGKYNVNFVIDDRPQVCDMWRERGLFLFQVGDPYHVF